VRAAECGRRSILRAFVNHSQSAVAETAAILLATDALSHSGGYRQYRG